MSWLSNFLATRRELERLARDNHYLRDRVAFLETKLDETDRLRFEREMLLLDRALTKNGSIAITDEAKKEASGEDKREIEAEQRLYLESKRRELIEEAEDAGRDIAEAETLYRKNEPQYIEDFQTMLN
jgi:hypothetical protein